jgi:hypothetical protein
MDENKPEVKKPDIDELNKLYEEGKKVDEELFAEQRSNILLVSGNHYSKKSSQTFFNRVRNSNRLSDSQKLRITENHVHKITRHYINSILSKVPGVAVTPQNDTEMSDRKAADLNQSVWADAKERYKFSELRREWGHNFVEIGEVAAFIYFDPDKGAVKGYEQLMGPDGMPVFNEVGVPMPDETKPVMEGEFCFKTIYGFNFLRTSGARTMRDAPVVIFREMVDAKELKLAYANDEKKLKFIGTDDSEEEYIIFDSQKQRYETTKQVMVRYHFFRPCRKYPQGWWTVSTDRGVLEEDELPFGIWPIAYKGFDEFASNPRGYSIVKVARPFQAEINRAVSQQATHQITIGDDKIIYQSGTKLAPGALLPGVRGLTYQGAAPQILPGRDGAHLAPYIDGRVGGMYKACMIEEINADDNLTAQLDPYTLLFRSASQAQKFGRYTEKFEEFLKEVCSIFLQLAKHYYDDGMFIRAVGKAELVNIAEFKRTEPLSFQIKLEPQSDTVDSKLGRQIALNHVLQYVGSQLDSKQIGLVLKEMPFLNNNSLFKRLSLDFENVENDMLAIERGQFPTVSQYSDNKVYIDALTHRMKQADFSLLQPQVQQAYQAFLAEHERVLTEKAKAAQAAKDGFIPTGGAMITCSMHMPDPERPGETKQVRLPYETLYWVIQRLQTQSGGMAELEKVNDGAVMDMAQQLISGGMPVQSSSPMTQ